VPKAVGRRGLAWRLDDPVHQREPHAIISPLARSREVWCGL